MKTRTIRSIRLRLLTLAAAVLSLATLGAAHARAQAMLTFAGGSNTPLSLTLDAPVTYTITTAPNGTAPHFAFQGLGNRYGDSVSGTMTFTIDGGAAYPFTNLMSGEAAGNLVATDAYIYGAFPGLAVGDTVVLNPGTLTTTDNFPFAPPAGGWYQTFVFDGTGAKLDGVNGAVVPEPSTWALLSVGVAVLGVVTLRRRSRAA